MLLRVDVDQFYGIEYDEFPARIAEVALWLMDHQMNMKASEDFGAYYVRLPLRKAATIVHGNALRQDWKEIIAPEDLSFILGNPPFVGDKYQSAQQKQDMRGICEGIKGAGVLDYVTAWYIKSADFIRNTEIKVGLVSTNSISQGEQVGILWNEMFTRYGAKIHFAHRTFQWNNEAKGKAAVHVVIVGFGCFDIKEKRLFEYEDIQGEAHEVKTENINPYLVGGNDVVIRKSSRPICNAPEMGVGNQPIDGGNYLFTEDEMNEFIRKEPHSGEYFRSWLGAMEFLQNKKRWVLWLGDAQPSNLKKMPLVMERINNVRRFRKSSKRKGTRDIAATPTRFHFENMPEGEYLLIPEVSSERRNYIPIGFIQPEVISSNLVKIIPNSTLYHFGILTSAMHMTWVKYTCGRLKSDYRYSAGIVYNNYPWPKAPGEKNKKTVELKAQGVLDARGKFPESSLADLYDPLTMPPVLVKAHQALDKAVDLCYRPQSFSSETGRIEFLFDLYGQYVNRLVYEKGKT